ncbi:hypothetical protein KJZ99_08235 [bacterium]|nr:hypothetical protein [bacterium]
MRYTVHCFIAIVACLSVSTARAEDKIAGFLNGFADNDRVFREYVLTKDRSLVPPVFALRKGTLVRYQVTDSDIYSQMTDQAWKNAQMSIAYFQAKTILKCLQDFPVSKGRSSYERFWFVTRAGEQCFMVMLGYDSLKAMVNKVTESATNKDEETILSLWGIVNYAVTKDKDVGDTIGLLRQALDQN